ncbi:MAG: hypothetical protein IKV94_05660 [Clostridia bacterium]|nr:hypothetical protein [Clostridia bacterium]
MNKRKSMQEDFVRPLAVRQIEFLEDEFTKQELMLNLETGDTNSFSKYPVVKYFADNTMLNMVVESFGLDILKSDTSKREIFPYMATTEGESFAIENEDIIEMLCLRANIELSNEGMIILYNRDTIVVTATCEKATKVDVDFFKEFIGNSSICAITDVLNENGHTIVTLKTTDDRVCKCEMKCLFDLFDIDLIDLKFKKI